VVAWRERNRDGVYETRYQEADALWWSAGDTVVLYEVKFTSSEQMRQRSGLRQVERAARAAQQHPRVNSVRTRLVYIGDAEERLLAQSAGVVADQDEPAFGIVWIAPEEVEWAVCDLGLTLPPHWLSKRNGYYLVPGDGVPSLPH
jgi:hypothetical protein